MEFEIQRATDRDISALAALCAEVQSLHEQMHPATFRHPTEDELKRLFRERMEDPAFAVFIAWASDEPVGYVVLHVIQKPAHVLVKARSCVEIDHIHVRESHRRQGVGRDLAAQALVVAREAAIETIQLSVWAQNSNAVAAFEAMGFAAQRHTMVLTPAPSRQ